MGNGYSLGNPVLHHMMHDASLFGATQSMQLWHRLFGAKQSPHHHYNNHCATARCPTPGPTTVTTPRSMRAPTTPNAKTEPQRRSNKDEAGRQNKWPRQKCPPESLQGLRRGTSVSLYLYILFPTDI